MFNDKMPIKYFPAKNKFFFTDDNKKPIGKGYSILDHLVTIKPKNNDSIWSQYLSLEHTSKNKLSGVHYFSVADKPKGKRYIINQYGQKLPQLLPKYDRIILTPDIHTPSAVLVNDNNYRMILFGPNTLHFPIITEVNHKHPEFKHLNIFHFADKKLIFVVNDSIFDYYEYLDYVNKHCGVLSIRRYKYLHKLSKLLKQLDMTYKVPHRFRLAK